MLNTNIINLYRIFCLMILIYNFTIFHTIGMVIFIAIAVILSIKWILDDVNDTINPNHNSGLFGIIRRLRDEHNQFN